MECTPTGCQPALLRKVSFTHQGKSLRADVKSGTAPDEWPASETAAPAASCLRLSLCCMRPPDDSYYTPARSFLDGCKALVIIVAYFMKPLSLFVTTLLACVPIFGQGQRRVFSKIFTGEPYTIECYLPQITNGPNFPGWSPDGKELVFAMKGSIW